jgi:hypothetical protein
MEPRNLSSGQPSLEEVRDQFENWRHLREKRAPIPHSLWQAAVSLCAKHSVYEISKALRLNYSDLKHRVEDKRSIFQAPSVSESAFIDLGLSAPMLPAECIVEMEDQKGATMRIYFKGETGLDLLELGKVFWSKRS